MFFSEAQPSGCAKLLKYNVLFNTDEVKYARKELSAMMSKSIFRNCLEQCFFQKNVLKGVAEHANSV